MRPLSRLVLGTLLLCMPISALAQAPPTRVPGDVSPSQEATIREGVDLHDKGQYDAAIAKYQEVLATSPSNVTALFELAYSYLAKKDFEHSFETAQKGAEFRSDLLPLFYDVMASSLDSRGQPQQAIDMYRKGLALAPDASQLYYNMAVTYRESLNQPDDARAALEKAAAIEPEHPGVQLLLGQVFQGTGYTTPAFLALSTFLILDPAGGQALPGYGLWRAVLKGGVDPLPDGSAGDRAMRAAPQAPPARRTDEGDFSAFETQLAPSHEAFMRRLDSGTPEVRSLIAQVDALLATLPAPDAAAPAPFATRHYVPFFIELRRKNYVEPFVYWASQRAPVPGVVEWIRANEPRVREFLDWASKYPWPKS